MIVSIAEWLGGKKVLRVEIRSELDLVNAVQKGLPTAALDAAIEHGLSQQEMERIVIPRRTLAHRIAKCQPLSRQESDKLARVARIMALAQETFGEAKKAGVWLRRSNRALLGSTPMDLIETEGGARLVEQELGRISHGVFS